MILNEVPYSEREYVAGACDQVLRNLLDDKPDDLQNLLSSIGKYNPQEDYGWSEAVLQERWFRFPSEIRSQIFCSENALRDQLIARSFGLDSSVVLIENYGGAGMPHEAIVVRDRENFHLVDWGNVHPVSFSGDRMIVEGIDFLAPGNSYLISDHDLVGRAHMLRNGDSFLDAVECGQHMLTHYNEYGRLDGYIKFSPPDRNLYISFIHLGTTRALHSYYELNINMNGFHEPVVEEMGVCDFSDKKPIDKFTIHARGKAGAFGNPDHVISCVSDFYRHLKDYQRQYFIKDCYYDYMTEREPGKISDLFLRSREELDEVTGMFRDGLNLEDETAENLCNYVIRQRDFLEKKVSEKTADKFMDYWIHHIVGLDESFEEADRQVRAKPDFAVDQMILSALMFDEIGSHFEDIRIRQSLDILIGEVSKKLGVRNPPRLPENMLITTLPGLFRD